MNPKLPSCVLLSCALVLTAPGADTRSGVSLRPLGAQAELTIRNQQRLPVAGQFSEYQVETSTDLRTWTPAGVTGKGEVGAEQEVLRLMVPTPGASGFFRVKPVLRDAPEGEAHSDAAYGLASQFHAELIDIGQLSLTAFREWHPEPAYLPGVTFDVTTAEFWREFNLDPAVHNATNTTEPRLTDYRLNPQEFAIFQTNGFVVSPRLGGLSFASAFYSLYTDDLPVYFSADAALQAWHFSYDKLLRDVEESWIAPTLLQMLIRMQGSLAQFATEANGTALQPAVNHADIFLAVARTLASGTNHYGVLGQNAQVSSILTAVRSPGIRELTLYGTNRTLDTSFFIARGHYTRTKVLSNYFRAMTWCAMADCRYTQSDTPELQLATAATLAMLLQRSGELTNWMTMDRLVQRFVGPPDNLTAGQLVDILGASGIAGPGDLATPAQIAALRQQLTSGTVGMQHVRNSFLFAPLSAEQLQLPRSFTFFSQRFTPDSWALSKVVFDDIIWDENGILEFEDKVMRRVPSSLDVAFSVLANNATTPIIADRIADTAGHPWRDGLSYQHNLTAVRRSVDAMVPEVWTNNIYWAWLGALRELSQPVTTAHPQAFRTRAWAMKDLNTQLAGWTQLRHDNLLYVKQSTTPPVLCSYPEGYVEPRPAFWARMEELSQVALRAIDGLPVNPGVGPFLTNFCSTMRELRNISEKQLARIPLEDYEKLFLSELVEIASVYNVHGRTYSGWYPALFYRNPALEYFPYDMGEGSDAYDALVADVHTDFPAPILGDPGSVLHNAVGKVNLLMVAVDCAPGDVAIYAGPVLSHYEFERPTGERLTDDGWKALLTTSPPPPPPWTRYFQAAP